MEKEMREGRRERMASTGHGEKADPALRDRSRLRRGESDEEVRKERWLRGARETEKAMETTNVAESEVVREGERSGGRETERSGGRETTGGEKSGRRTAMSFKQELTLAVEIMGEGKITALELIHRIRESCGEVAACRYTGSNKYEFTMVDQQGKERLLDGLRMGQARIMAKELTNDELIVSFLGLPAYVADTVIIEKLTGWGVKAISPIARRLWPGTRTADGTRFVKVKFTEMVQSLPYSARFETAMGPEYFRVIHDKQVKVCRMCIQPGHILRECPEFQCRKCGEQGHYARECWQRGERCGDCRERVGECKCGERAGKGRENGGGEYEGGSVEMEGEGGEVGNEVEEREVENERGDTGEEGSEEEEKGKGKEKRKRKEKEKEKRGTEGGGKEEGRAGRGEEKEKGKAAEGGSEGGEGKRGTAAAGPQRAEPKTSEDGGKEGGKVTERVEEERGAERGWVSETPSTAPPRTGDRLRRPGKEKRASSTDSELECHFREGAKVGTEGVRMRGGRGLKKGGKKS